MHHPATCHGLVVSDLHLLSRRSEGETLFEGLASQLDASDVLVLNGDTFDFRWSSLPSEAASIDAAIRWIEDLTTGHPRLEVRYLLGNHDCLAVFHRELEQLVRSVATLQCHEHQFELGDNLFLHGDCANYRMDGPGLAKARRPWINDRQRGRIAATSYDWSDALGLSRLVHELYFPQHRTVRRIAHHLDHTSPDWHRRFSRCFFGHTHRPFHSYEWRGVEFSNTGSAIPGMGFQPLTFDWRPEPSHSHERKSHLLL